MSSRRSLAFLIALIISLLAIVPFSSQAYADESCKNRLLTEKEFSSLLTRSSSEIGEGILNKLNGYRDLVGNCALKVVHTNGNVKYQQTEPIFVAPRDGGGFIYAVVIH